MTSNKLSGRRSVALKPAICKTPDPPIVPLPIPSVCPTPDPMLLEFTASWTFFGFPYNHTWNVLLEWLEPGNQWHGQDIDGSYGCWATSTRNPDEKSFNLMIDYSGWITPLYRAQKDLNPCNIVHPANYFYPPWTFFPAGHSCTAILVY